MTAAPSSIPTATPSRGPLCVSILAAILVIGTIDPAGSYPELLEGPGITLDEVFNVEMGAYQWEALLEQGWRLWTPAVRDQVFADGPGATYNPDHPPLGRLWLGFFHKAVRTLCPPVETGAATVTACARVGSAIAFALTVFLVGRAAGRWFGRTAAWTASLALLLMPRVFAHAHLAALETVTNLAFTATILYVADRCASPVEAGGSLPRPTYRSALIAGFLLGLALLTKIQAVLLPLPIGLCILWRFRLRGLPWFALFGLTGAAIFFLGWPWLWIDPLQHLREYFARGLERQTLYCYYLGQRYADTDVPWHYPWVIFAVTVPIGIHVLALIGACSRSVRTGLLLGTVLFVLAFFARPGGHLYDGERLFLVVFPLAAVLTGAGAQRLHDWCVSPSPRNQTSYSLGSPAGRGAGGEGLTLQSMSSSRRRITALVLLGLLAAESTWAIITLHPCQLSYYSLSVGGLRGADRLGMERTYWQDSLTRSFLTEVTRQVPEGATIDLAPRLHPIQDVDLLLQSPVLSDHDIQLRAYDDKQPRDVRYIIVFRRRADPWSSLEPAPLNSNLLADVRRQGVQLSALYEVNFLPREPPP
jgi:hypothetical protein